MGKFHTNNIIEAQEVNGSDTEVGDEQNLIVKNHWLYKELVILEFGNETITVDSDALQQALENARNAH